MSPEKGALSCRTIVSCFILYIVPLCVTFYFPLPVSVYFPIFFMCASVFHVFIGPCLFKSLFFLFSFFLAEFGCQYHISQLLA